MATTQPASKKAFRRAAHACLKCRVRKVRCDVTIRGRPCMNCSLDGEECNVEDTERTRLREAGISWCRCRTRGLARGKLSIGNPMVSQTEPRGRDGGIATVASSNSTTSPTLTAANLTQSYGGRDTSPWYMASRCAGDYEFRQEKTVHEGSPPLIDDAVSSRYYIGYSHYRFITADNIFFIPARDYQFLQQEGCLHVPIRPILDVFVRHYFLHMHPMLPILDEGTFWDTYDQCPSVRHSSHTTSLLIFQTMLFTCCNFVPQNTLKKIGFDTARNARASFYRRAKLLFNLEAESSFVVKSQAALLLASWSFSSYEIPRKPNIPWLSIAIQHARDAGAHNYNEFSHDSEECIVRKRLWWCCIIRDRLFSLGMRRQIHITATQFDVAHNSGLGYQDLVREMHRSKVHDVTTKVRLSTVFELLVQLCTILTDILEVAFPIERNLTQSNYSPEVERRVRDSRIALHNWHGKALAQLPNPAKSSRKQRDSVVLYTNLVYMYYYSTKAILGHYEILHIATSAVSSTTQSASVIALQRNHFELQDAALEITSCLQKLADRELIRLLPVTAVSCTALPLLLHILGIEVSSSILAKHPSQMNLMSQRLDVLQMAMKTYQLQYEGVSWITESINRVVTIARAELAFTDRGLIAPASTTPQGTMDQERERDGCVEMLTFQPGWYLRMAFSIDVVLAKGRLPMDQNFSRSFHELILTEAAQSDDHYLNREWDAENGLASISNVTGEQKDVEPVATTYDAAPRERITRVAEPYYTITEIIDPWGAYLFRTSETEQIEGNTGSRLGAGFTANTPSMKDTIIAGDEGSATTDVDIFTLLSREESGSNGDFGLDLSPGGSTL